MTAAATYPDNLKYTKEHEWILINATSGTIGITAFAIDQLGDVVHLDLPAVGKSFGAGETFGTIESTKTVSDLYMPVGGTIVAVNTALVDSPEKIIEDPHGKCWLVQIKPDGEPKGLIDAAAYKKYIDEAANQ